MKFFGRISILVSAVSVAVVGCGGGGNPPPAVTTPFTVMSNTFDPLLVSAKIDDGTVVEYFGTRDADGLPTSLNAVTLTASGGEQTAFTLDSEGRPVMATAPNGVQMTFDWIEQRKVVIVATTPDGQTQVSTVVDFDAPQQGSPSIFSDGAVGNGVAMRQGQRATLELKPARQSMSPLAPGLRDVAITVKVCDVPDPNPVQVFLTITPGLTKQPITVPAKFVGNGIYSATVPDGAAATVDFGELCETSAVVLGYGCTAIELLGPAAPTLICAGISAAIDLLLGGPTGEGLLIFAACQKITAGLVIYCETIGQSIPGGPSLLDMLCKSEFINRTITGDVTIQAWVNALPSNVQSARVTAPGDGPFPPLSIDLGGSPTIRTLTLEPANPLQGQSYVGTVDIFCLPGGTVVTLSIVGTDGYEDSVTYTLPDTQVEGQFEINVPGAESGVKDTVTIEVMPPESATLTRVAFLVFS